ncbi:MAG: NUDIX hydrolase [Culicoidibacterales bacterium]
MEHWDLYDENRQRLAQIHTRGSEMPLNTFHLVTDVWTVNYDDQILITQRHPSKKHGLCWECTGGAAIVGEDSISSALRELAEETGIQLHAHDLTLLHSVQAVERFVDTYITRQNITLTDVTIQTEEVVAARFVTFDQLVKLWECGELVPRERFGMYKQQIFEFIQAQKKV